MIHLLPSEINGIKCLKVVKIARSTEEVPPNDTTLEDNYALDARCRDNRELTRDILK